MNPKTDNVRLISGDPWKKFNLHVVVVLVSFVAVDIVFVFASVLFQKPSIKSLVKIRSVIDEILVLMLLLLLLFMLLLLLQLLLLFYCCC